MNTHERNHEEYECNFRNDLIAQRLQEILPKADVRKVGYLIFIMMENSTWTLHQLAENTFDLCGKISSESESTFEEMGINQDRVELVLISAYENEEPVNEIKNPLADDPLGKNARKEGRRLNESGSMQRGGITDIQESAVGCDFYGSELFSYLKEVLPLAENECSIIAGNFVIEVDALQIRVIPKGANLFDVETHVGEKSEPKQVQLSYGETLQYVFDWVSAAGRAKNDDDINFDDDDMEETTAEILKELAGDLGKPTDIFRNRSLFNLRAGLMENKQSPRKATDDLLAGLDKHLHLFANLKYKNDEPVKFDATQKAKWFRGHPVALNENFHGKTLAYVQNAGVIIADKNDLASPDALKLSWDAERGAVLIPVTQHACRPKWNYFR